MKNRNSLLGVVALLVMAGLAYGFRGRIDFNWGVFFGQLRYVSAWHLLAGVALIHATFWLRALRWKVFLSPTKHVDSNRLVGPMFIGFAAVSLFGRLADLTRPYLLAKRVGLPVSTQVAVYTVERMFDLGAAAIVFSSALALAPVSLPHRENYVHVGVLSMAATLAIAAFAVFVRVAGGRIAAFVEGGGDSPTHRVNHPNERRPLAGDPGAAMNGAPRPSHDLRGKVAEKVLGFRDGLNAIAAVREFVVALALSVAMWALIGESYVQVAHAFVQTPELAGLSYARTMLLFAASLGGSLLQLPVVGWFTQIAVMAASMREFYGAPTEAATACGALLLVVNNLSIVPTGMVFARLEGEKVGAVVDAAGDGE